jgi:hypothetical protein
MRRRGRSCGRSIWLTQQTTCGRKTSKDEAINMETMQGIADELVRIEGFPKGDGVNPSTWVVTFGSGRGACKLTYGTREAAEGMETALKRLVWQAMGKGQALCVRRDERG